MQHPSTEVFRRATRLTETLARALVLASLLAASATGLCAQQRGGEGAGQQAGTPQRYEREGVAVEFTAEPVARGKGPGLLEGTEATVRFRVADASGTPLTSLRPAAWFARRKGEAATDLKGCREKVQAFLQSSFSDRPDIDLNGYFVLTLNHEPNISVIDPLSGLGTTKLYTLVALPGPGEDWVMSGDKKRLYVSVPSSGQVSVIDTVTWKVVANVEAGPAPARLALQRDGKYLWVANDADGAAPSPPGGVTVIDTATLKVAARLTTGRGPHEIALADDDRHAFVANAQAGTLSVIDVRRLAVVKDVKIGARPTALAYSPLARAVYVADEAEGTITAVGGAGHEVLARLKAQPGLRALRFLAGGRFGFAVNRAAATVYIFDASTNQPVQAVPVGPAPDQITFTRDFAYVRSGASEFVTMIKISGLGREPSEVAVNRFPAGQRAPRESSSTSAAAAVVPAPESGAVLVANPADKMIYFYTEGMAAPMGSFQNYRREPRAVLVLDNSLTETAPGVYTTTVRLGAPGRYDVAFLLDTPRMVNCFDLAIGENPDLPKKKEAAVKVEPLAQGGALRVGESHTFRFKVTDAVTGRPVEPKDMGVLVFLAPGIWQQRDWATALGGGTYETRFTPPQAGVYYLYFQVPSLGIKYNQIPFLVLQASQGDAPPAPKGNQP